MSALIAVELRRLVQRRLFRGLSALALIAFVVGGIAAYIASDDSPAAIAEANARRRSEVAACVKRTQVEVRAGIEELPAKATADPRAFCNEEVWVSDPRFAYRELPWMLSSLGLPLMLLGWLLGASSVGAEWHHRTIATLLTWEPRRVRVLVAKAFAAVLAAFVWVAALAALFGAAFYPAAAFEGTLDGIDALWWEQVLGLVLRIGALGSFAGLVGVALATIGRKTAAALGVGFVYLAVVETLVRAFRPSWVDWLVGDNIGLALVGPADVLHLDHSQAAAGLLLAAYAVALFAAALFVFQRRDLA